MQLFMSPSSHLQYHLSLLVYLGLVLCLGSSLGHATSKHSNGHIQNHHGNHRKHHKSDPGDGIIRASECIKQLGNENANELIHPDRLTSTGYRAYMATIAQCLGLKDHQIQWLCTHLGHTIDVHQSHYRFALDGIERIQLGKLLLLQDKNLLSKFKDTDLKDIEFEDIISCSENTVAGSCYEEADPSEVQAAPSQEQQLDVFDAFEIVFPQIVENRGGIIVNDVKNYVRRRKRNLGENKPLEVNIAGKDEMFELELWENEALVAPGFKVYRRQTLQQAAQREETVQDDVLGCHFTGHVRSQPHQHASISICDGMNGLIRTEKDDFLIEPIKDMTMQGAGGFVGQPHKLYKRSLMDAGHQHKFEAKTAGKRDVVVERRGEEEIDDDEEEVEVTKTEKDVEERSLETNLHSIKKRAAYKYKFLRELNTHKTVEMLVVVDKNMYHKHGDANITTYTLTLFNMLSQLFKDGSLGNKINVVLVGLILLEGDERGLNIDYNADDTLNSFCQWQSVLVGANGRQHDHAILLTGLDLCSYKNAPCDTLGFAPMEGMCNRVRSCTVNEDTGLSTAFTIAHEVGHNFGMFHDGEGNYCTESAGKIMSPTLMGKDGQFHWSVCSKAYLMRFLNTPQSDCLDDEPKQVAELKFPDKLPGELYNADIQCKWQFGSRARLCTYDFGKDICKALWCYRGNKRCETKFLPAAEGTSCGKGMWCRQGKCVDYGHNGPKPIDGGWSTWSEWSECSRSCGGGVITRDRECSRPLPQYGGKTCEGDDKVYKMCNVEECPEHSADFHTAQCSTYNKQPFKGWYLQWKPQRRLNDVNEPCTLHCIADTPSYVFTIKHTTTDGMTCGHEDKNNVCVEGDCRPVGCDWVVGSKLKNDLCGVCDGDNSTCRLIHGEYLEQPQLNTYFPVTIIPKNARSIHIREKSLSSNYLAVRNIFGTYFLNGHQRVAWPGTYKLGGTKFKYNRPYNEPEILLAEGPLEEELVLEILVQDRNPGIVYEYTLPKTELDAMSASQPDNYTWTMGVTSCSEPCAGGKKTVSTQCQRNFEEEVDSSFCNHLDKPDVGEFPCHEQPCEPRWVVEEWRNCTKTCGGGKQKRKVRCRQKVSSTKDKKLKRKMCKHLRRPIQARRCNEQECPPDWHKGQWSKCSASCGGGDQTRKVTCRSKKGKGSLPDTMCHSAKPDVLRSCNHNSCPVLELVQVSLPCEKEPCGPHWVTSQWGRCTRRCGAGVQKRKLNCETADGVRVKNRLCRQEPKPERKQECNVQDCEPQWKSGKWSLCSASCDGGTQHRKVICSIRKSKGFQVVNETVCTRKKPTKTKTCNTVSCQSTEEYDWLLSPWGPCSHTCGAGLSHRYLRCSLLTGPNLPVIVADQLCEHLPQPQKEMVDNCSIMECPGEGHWNVTDWGQCSKSCGSGMKSRIVSCVNGRGQPSENCDVNTRPLASQKCNNGECMPTPLGLLSCEDKFDWCYLVPHHKVCRNPLYSKNCCKSCNQRYNR